ncbi:uncharacterized protein LOC134176674 [Corticium candelabrum]|uniref:uncharacterized protein LOC134176674 n=1 Tax=Corticium candelabrum TaxID=121492 RepID=UPI002E262F79|nr:uncharacterized protein LOC134176674 [Corticium candelabrum]
MKGEDNVYLFVPNLIGYVRVLLAVVGFYLMTDWPYLTVSLYFISGLLDAFDGYAARVLKQGTKLGSTLDMLTDRCATLCLLMALGVFYPQHLFAFQMLVSLDIVSHWLQMYSSLIRGEESHKMVDISAHPLLKIYYTSRTVLFMMCSLNEICFMMMYLLHFSEGFTVPKLDIGLWRLGLYLSAPFMVLKQAISAIQLVGATRVIVHIDHQDRRTQHVTEVCLKLMVIEEIGFSISLSSVFTQSAMIVASKDGKVNVFLFIPNLIGYVRLIFLFIAFMIMNELVGHQSPGLAVAFYMTSVLLDEVDGMAARKFEQESKLGVMLDLITDKCSTMCLFITLTHCYPHLTMLFQVLMTIDIFSHWFLSVSSALANKSSHKAVNEHDVNSLLWLYYNNSMFLTCMSIGNESFYVLLYMLSYSSGPAIGLFGLGMWKLLACLLLPIAVLKQVVNVIQLKYAASQLAAIDGSDRDKSQ